jgi:hypothetical protein
MIGEKFDEQKKSKSNRLFIGSEDFYEKLLPIIS